MGSSGVGDYLIMKAWEKGAIVGGVWGLVSWMLAMANPSPRIFVKIVMFHTYYINEAAISARQYDTFVYFFLGLCPQCSKLSFLSQWV